MPTGCRSSCHRRKRSEAADGRNLRRGPAASPVRLQGTFQLNAKHGVAAKHGGGKQGIPHDGGFAPSADCSLRPCASRETTWLAPRQLAGTMYRSRLKPFLHGSGFQPNGVLDPALEERLQPRTRRKREAAFSGQLRVRDNDPDIPPLIRTRPRAPRARFIALRFPQNGLASTSQTITTRPTTGTSLNQRNVLDEGSRRPAAAPLSQRPLTM